MGTWYWYISHSHSKIIIEKCVVLAMSFLKKFELYSFQSDTHIFVEELDYAFGEYKRDNKGRLSGPNEFIKIKDLDTNDIEINEYIKKHNDEEYLRLLKDEKVVISDLQEDGECPKYLNQINFIKLAKSVFKYWYRRNNHTLPAILEVFRHSPDYSSIVLNNKKFVLTPKQSSVIKILHKANNEGSSALSKDEIFNQIEAEDETGEFTMHSEKLSAVFKDKNDKTLFRKLIKEVRKGRYMINFS